MLTLYLLASLAGSIYMLARADQNVTPCGLEEKVPVAYVTARVNDPRADV